MTRIFNTGVLLLVSVSLMASSKKDGIVSKEIKEPAVQLVNIFKDQGAAKAQYDDSPVSEQPVNILDNNAETKFLTFNASSWVNMKSYDYYVVTEYSITSANDAPERDPKKWALKGSADGENWVVLDKQKEQSFSERGETKSYTFENDAEYRHYRIEMSNNSGDILQVADVILYGTLSKKDLPIANAKLARSKMVLGEAIQLENLSTNADSYEWYFGDENTSTENAPKHTYAAGGLFDITLVAKKNGKTDKETIKDVFVMDMETCWTEFVYPKVEYRISVDKNHPGIKLIEQATGNKVEEYMRAQTKVVAELIYKCPQEAPQLTNFVFDISEETAIAAKGNVPGGIIIWMNPNHIVKEYEKAKEQGGEQAGMDRIIYELKGVMTHELAHGYQNVPQGAGGYKRGDDYFGFLEGVADYSRIVAGLHVDRKKVKGGNWNDGYTTSGFFIQWIEENKKPEFAYLLNESCNNMMPWSWEQACQEIVGMSVQDLWDEYQKSIE